MSSQDSISDPMDPAQDAHDIYKAFLDMKDKYQHVLDIKRPKSPKLTRDTSRVDAREFDPEDFLLSADQYKRYYALRIGGRKGLMETVKKQCSDHQSTTAKPGDTDRHRHVLDDFTRTPPQIPTILASILPPVLLGMLRGSVTERIYHDKDFASLAEDQLQPDHSSCIYLCEIVNRERDQGVEHPYPGRCLNWHEWVQVVRTMKDYLTAYNNGTTTPLTDEVDSTSPKTDKADFRYMTRRKMSIKIGEFVQECENLYVKRGESIAQNNLQDPRLNVCFRRKIGWAVDGAARKGQYIADDASNSLLMFYRAVLWREFGTGRFKTVWLSVCEVADPFLAQTAEYFCSEMAGTFWYQGGLNPELAGTIKMSSAPTTKQGSGKAITNVKYRKFFDTAASLLVYPTEMSLTIEEERQSEIKRMDKLKYLEANPRDQFWSNLEEDRSKTQKELEACTERARRLLTETLCKELEDVFASEKEE